MARTGFQKVKTGCTTCKARKVKCDETWPQCRRCTSTGRTCDGYRAPPTGSLSWDLLLRARPCLVPVANTHEVRSLSFFHHAVAPVLSGPFDGSFWTHLVAQMTHAEPAARHAVLAISSLFEGFEPSTPDGGKVDRFAIFHYNQAIKEVVQHANLDIDVVLLVCILFICIEFLRGDRETAISHARHGVQLLNAAGKNSRLNAMFSQMSIFPLFFVDTLVDFPHLPSNVYPTDTASPVFHSLMEAQHALDLLCIRTLRLIRAGNAYRFRFVMDETPPALFAEQEQLLIALEVWGRAFTRFQISRSSNEDTPSLALMTRQTLAKIWASECLTPGEMGYDALKTDFERVVEFSRRAAAIHDALDDQRPKFMFDMGFNPMLHFIILKCRYLHLRVEALTLLKRLSCARESLWDATLMYDVSRRIIEVEHGVELTSEYLAAAEASPPVEEELPPDEKRIRGFTFDENAEMPLWDDRRDGATRAINLMVWSPDGGMAIGPDFITRQN